MVPLRRVKVAKLLQPQKRVLSRDFVRSTIPAWQRGRRGDAPCGCAWQRFPHGPRHRGHLCFSGSGELPAFTFTVLMRARSLYKLQMLPHLVCCPVRELVGGCPRRRVHVRWLAVDLGVVRRRLCPLDLTCE